MKDLRKQMQQNPIMLWLAGAGTLAIIAVIIVVISNQGGPPAIVGDYSIRSLSELSESDLNSAVSDGIIPHQRLADGGFVLGFPEARRSLSSPLRISPAPIARRTRAPSPG